MNHIPDPILDEELWRKWLHRGKMRDEATRRRTRVLVGVAAGVLLLAGGAWFGMVR